MLQNIILQKSKKMAKANMAKIIRIRVSIMIMLSILYKKIISFKKKKTIQQIMTHNNFLQAIRL